MTFQEFLTWIKDLILATGPALAELLWEVDQQKIDEQKLAKEKAQTDLQLKENEDAIKTKYSDVSDIDIVNNAIADGGGSTSGPSTTDSTSPINRPSKSNSDANDT
jgi:hypothetical protein